MSRWLIIGFVVAASDALNGARPPPSKPDAGVQLEEAAFPRRSALEQFVPIGWETVAEAEGDLSADGLPDKIMFLCPSSAVQQMKSEKENWCGACVPTDFNCVAIALKGLRTGWELWGVERSFTMNASLSVDLQIARGILQVHASQGGHYSSSEWTKKYRSEAGRLMLIGADEEFDSYPADSVQTSTNWLTGRMTSRQCEAAGNEDGCDATKTSRVPKKRLFWGDGVLK